MADDKKATDIELKKTSAPAFLNTGDSAHGFEDLNVNTMAIPFIKVLNAQSPELSRKRNEYIEGASIGDLVNTITHKNYGKIVDFTVVKFEHIFVEWKPNRGGFVGYHTPVQAEQKAVDKTVFGKWVTREGNLLQDTYMFYWVIQGHEADGVVVFSADSADIKNAKKLNSMMLSNRFADGTRALPYHQVYTAESVEVDNGEQTWWQLTYSFKGYVDEKLYLEAVEQRKLLEQKSVDYSLIEGGTGTAQKAITAEHSY